MVRMYCSLINTQYKGVFSQKYLTRHSRLTILVIILISNDIYRRVLALDSHFYIIYKICLLYVCIFVYLPCYQQKCSRKISEVLILLFLFWDSSIVLCFPRLSDFKDFVKAILHKMESACCMLLFIVWKLLEKVF